MKLRLIHVYSFTTSALQWLLIPKNRHEQYLYWKTAPVTMKKPCIHSHHQFYIWDGKELWKNIGQQLLHTTSVWTSSACDNIKEGIPQETFEEFLEFPLRQHAILQRGGQLCVNMCLILFQLPPINVMTIHPTVLPGVLGQIISIDVKRETVNKPYPSES